MAWKSVWISTREKKRQAKCPIEIKVAIGEFSKKILVILDDLGCCLLIKKQKLYTLGIFFGYLCYYPHTFTLKDLLISNSTGFSLQWPLCRLGHGVAIFVFLSVCCMWHCKTPTSGGWKNCWSQGPLLILAWDVTIFFFLLPFLKLGKITQPG